MAIVGFEFNSINVEKKDVAKSSINISNNIALVDVVRQDLNVGGTKQPGIRFAFEYKSSYEPDFAKIVLGGSVMYLTDETNAKEILGEWSTNKKLKKEVAEQVVNSILTKCNIQSILLANTVNLPPPVPMPKVNITQNKGKPAKKEELKPSKDKK
ncbi:TPA: hypothetical protein HA265_03140 [Candidatus Woesearchaeota archaeon]|nr:hypothetical protein [Candidatus Woesearchaeota archaeon]